MSKYQSQGVEDHGLLSNKFIQKIQIKPTGSLNLINQILLSRLKTIENISLIFNLPHRNQITEEKLTLYLQLTMIMIT